MEENCKMKNQLISSPAQVEMISRGAAPTGNVAKRLLNSNMNPKALRGNDTLLYDEWKEFDSVVLQASQDRLVGVADLMSRNLVYRTKGLGAMVLAYQDASDIDDASMDMDGLSRGVNDRPEYDINYLPLPIIHKDFQISSRELAASRAGLQPLDTTNAALAAIKVADYAEQILFQGAGAYTFGGGTIRGYQDHANRNTQTLTQDWDASGKTGAEIFTDVNTMIQAMITDKHYGPYVLYIPTAYETVLNEDYSTQYPRSIKQRLLEISSLQDIKVADKLSANNVVMVSMTQDVVRLVEGLAITTVQWDIEGGMGHNFKVMAILVPQIRKTQEGESGIVHLS
jgi:YD repeat-containing protein